MNSTLRICYNIIHILGLCFCILIPWYYFPLSRIPTPLFCILFIMLLYPYTYRCYFYLSRIHAPLFCILYIMLLYPISWIMVLRFCILYPIQLFSCILYISSLSWKTVLLCPLYIHCILFKCAPVSSIYPLYPCILYISFVSWKTVLLYPDELCSSSVSLYSLYIPCIIVNCATYPIVYMYVLCILYPLYILCILYSVYTLYIYVYMYILLLLPPEKPSYPSN